MAKEPGLDAATAQELAELANSARFVRNGQVSNPFERELAEEAARDARAAAAAHEPVAAPSTPRTLRAPSSRPATSPGVAARTPTPLPPTPLAPTSFKRRHAISPAAPGTAPLAPSTPSTPGEASGRTGAPLRRAHRVAAPTPVTPFIGAPTQGWPSVRARRSLAWLGYICLLALFATGVLMDGGRGTWPSGVKLLGHVGDLAVVLPSIPKHHSSSTLWYLVALGDPKVFGVLIVTLLLVALRRGDWRLGAVLVVAPGVTMALDEFVAKPTFFLLNGGHYGFPSGHVSGAAAVCCALLVVVRRRFGAKAFAVVAPVACTGVAAALVGVVALHMHTAKDAIGGALFSIGTMSLLTALILRSPKSVTSSAKNKSKQRS